MMNAEMKCKYCQFWRLDHDEYNDMRGVGKCTKAVEIWDVSEWTGTVRALKPEYVDQMMFVGDGSDYKANLFTRSDFFCAHFTAHVVTS